MLPSTILVILGEDSVVGTITKKVVYLILNLAIILFPLSFLKPKWYGWIVFLISLFVLFEIYTVSIFKAPSTEEALASVFFTNYGEATELLSGNILSFIRSNSHFVYYLFISIINT